MKNTITILIYLLIFNLSFAQQYLLDTTFNSSDIGFGSGIGPNNSISSILTQNDHKILVFGDFNSYNNEEKQKYFRINENGTIDNSFVNCTLNGGISKALFQSNGKIIIIGSFTIINGQNRKNIARLNADGSFDPTFMMDNTPNYYIGNMIINENDEIFILGPFTTLGSLSYKWFAKLSPNGSLITSFELSGTGFNQPISEIQFSNDGNFLVSGNFTDFNGVPCMYLEKVDMNGQIVNAFNFTNIFDNVTSSNREITSILPLSDGKILISASTEEDTKLFRLFADGTIDPSYNINNNRILNNDTTLFVSSKVSEMIELPSGKIIISGAFNSFNDTVVSSYVLQLLENGDLDTSFTLNQSYTPFNSCINLVKQYDNKILLGGRFIYGSKLNLQRILENGEIDHDFNPLSGVTSLLEGMVEQSDGKYLIFSQSSFNYFNNFPNYIYRIFPNGNIDTSFKCKVNGSINTAVVQPDGKIVIGGSFNTVNYVTRNLIARLNQDGSLDTNFVSPNYVNGGMYSNSYVGNVILNDDNTFLVSGLFCFIDPISNIGRISIARLTSNGFIDPAFGVTLATDYYGFGLKINDIIKYNDKYFAVGNFTKRITKINYNGSIDPSFNVGYGFSGYPNRLYLTSDDKIFVNGSLESYQNVNCGDLIRLNLDGTKDENFLLTGINADKVNNLLEINNQYLLVGFFNENDGIFELPSSKRHYFARINYNGSLDSSLYVKFGTNKSVANIFQNSENKLFLMGDFTSYDSIGRNKFLKLRECQPSYNYLNETTCNEYNLNGQTYYISGVYYQKVPGTNYNGCDSLIVLNLTINNNSSQIDTVNCDNLIINGINYTQSGTYTQNLINSLGCDSLLTINYQNLKTNATLNINACDSFSLNGVVYTNSGIYTQVLNNANNCDSILALNLNIQNNDSTISVSGLNGYVYNNTLYSQSGIYEHHYVNSNGCDSTVFLDLQLDYLGLNETNYDISIYPNPVFDKVNINSKAKIEEIKIYDLSGQEQISIYGADSLTTNVIDISRLKFGIYIIELKINKVYYYYKINKHE